MTEHWEAAGSILLRRHAAKEDSQDHVAVGAGSAAVCVAVAEMEEAI